MTMPRWEAIVVGGGPGGSTAAWQLARAGVRTLCVDAAAFPRVKICAGWVTHEALRDLELAPRDYPHTLQPFRACRVGFGGRVGETRWRAPASFGILRREFDHFLLDRAARAGAEVRQQARVTAVAVGLSSVRVTADGETHEADVVVGAGGHRCPVALALGDVSAREEVVVAQESETRLTPEWLARLGSHLDAPEIWVEPDLRGYAWWFPKREVVNIGVGCTGGEDGSLPRRRDAILSALRRSGRLPAGMPLEPFRGHAYAVRRRAPRRLAGPRFCLVGDAAGLARDLSGEGIGPAIRSGMLAAAAVTAFLRRGVELEAYAREIVARYGPGEPGWLGRAAARLPAAVQALVVRGVLGVAGLRRRVVFDGIFGMREEPA